MAGDVEFYLKNGKWVIHEKYWKICVVKLSYK